MSDSNIFYYLLSATASLKSCLLAKYLLICYLIMITAWEVCHTSYTTNRVIMFSFSGTWAGDTSEKPRYKAVIASYITVE